MGSQSLAKFSVIGSGDVGQVLADALLSLGHPVLRASREPQKLADWHAKAGPLASIGSLQDAASFGDAFVLAVNGRAACDVVDQLGAETLAGKLVIDPTNPIAADKPEHGVLRYFTGPNESLMERLQQRAPKAHFVKAFSCTGSPNFVRPRATPAGRPTMFICGDDKAAKQQVVALLDAFGWDSEDMGAAQAARAIEPLCMLWCIRGFAGGGWTHTFTLNK